MAYIYETSPWVYSVEWTKNETISSNNRYDLTYEDIDMLNRVYANTWKTQLMNAADDITNKKRWITNLFNEYSDRAIWIKSNSEVVEDWLKKVWEIAATSVKTIFSFFKRTVEKLQEKEVKNTVKEIDEDEALKELVWEEKAEEFKQRKTFEEAEILDYFDPNIIVEDAVPVQYEKVKKTTFSYDEIFWEDEPKVTVEEVENVEKAVETITDIFDKLSTPEAEKEVEKPIIDLSKVEAENITIKEVKTILEDLKNYNWNLAERLWKNLENATPERAEALRRTAIISYRKYMKDYKDETPKWIVADYIVS